MSTSETRKFPTPARMRRFIGAELDAAIVAVPTARHWYREHHFDIGSWAEDNGVTIDRAAAAAATISPGLDPERETAYLSWCLAAVPSPESRPHKFATPRGYAPFNRGRDCLLGDRGMPDIDRKTGNYGRSILDPEDPNVVAIDVWAFRTTCGDPLDSTRPLANLTPREYREVRQAWLDVAKSRGLLGSEAQALCWVYRRGSEA